ncbi:hypothetical protein ACEN8K_06385 [Variovorax sp. CT11-76]
MPARAAATACERASERATWLWNTGGTPAWAASLYGSSLWAATTAWARTSARLAVDWNCSTPWYCSALAPSENTEARTATERRTEDFMMDFLEG